MKKVFKIENTDKTVNIEIADSFFKRFLGLMGKKSLESDVGLLIIPCNSIHMMFMLFSIDAVYLDKDMKVLKVVKNLKPWIGFSMCLKAESVLEINTGNADKLGICEGVRLVEL